LPYRPGSRDAVAELVEARSGHRQRRPVPNHRDSDCWIGLLAAISIDPTRTPDAAALGRRGQSCDADLGRAARVAHVVRCTSTDLGRPGLRNPPAKRHPRPWLLRHAKAIARCWPRRRRPYVAKRSIERPETPRDRVATQPCLRVHASERDRRCDAAARKQLRSLCPGASNLAATAMLVLAGNR
jgi:hypothetical protein